MVGNWFKIGFSGCCLIFNSFWMVCFGFVLGWFGIGFESAWFGVDLNGLGLVLD